ncbi:MAG TPA: ATPase, partial [Novosphingobium sp.]|nr:ATPase [Novosphingobium sp.]
QALSGHVSEAAGGLTQALTQVEALSTILTAEGTRQAEQVDAMRASLESVRSESLGLAEQAQAELRKAIDELNASAKAAVSGIAELSAGSISKLAASLGEESGAAIEKAMRSKAAEVAGQLELAASHAAGVSREAAVQLRDQLAKVNELTAHLERRVAHARSKAEDQVDNDFARRVALITESLNSNAIDIARGLDTDVTDTAWAAYLKGDRGIFTRRAVKLLDSGEAKAVAQLYEQDRTFREHVSRYIHDFEAMLRQLLSTRDGHALGVTILSSDMGKLYVALAQAIERLRN